MGTCRKREFKLLKWLVRIELIKILACTLVSGFCAPLLYAAEPAAQPEERRASDSVPRVLPRASAPLHSPWRVETVLPNSHFGSAVSAAGDVNGDGYGDILVGARLYGESPSKRGGAFLYHGAIDGLKSTPDWFLEGPTPRAWLGSAVASAGDVNRDGFGDIIVGAWRHELNCGIAYVYLGSTNGIQQEPAWMKESPGPASFGFSVGSAGDVNGDGFDDIIVGAPAVSPERDRKFVAVYYGKSSGVEETEAWTAESFQMGSRFGATVSSAGDVNGDGFSDVIIGACQDARDLKGGGRVVVHFGSRNGLSEKPDWVMQGNQAHAYFGYAVASAGDLNGDGFSDVVITAPNYSNTKTNEGKVSVYYGSDNGISPQPDWWAVGNAAGAYFGIAAKGAGDVNRDGFDDLIVGATTDIRGQESRGRAYVFYGSRSGLGTRVGWAGQGEQPWAEFGISVGSAGDVNGDGYADVLIGAFRDNLERGGRAYVYPGSRLGVAGGILHTNTAPLPTAVRAAIAGPPFWKSWWFVSLGGLSAVAMGGWGIQHISLRRERAKVSALRMQNALNEERSRIAKDMHDGLGASLTHMTLLSELVKQNLGRDGEVQQYADKLATSARSVVQAMDEIVWALNPSNDSFESFITYLSQYAHDYLDTNHIRSWQEWPDSVPERTLPSDVRHHLFLVVKESLHNVVKHANAAQVWMHLQLNDASLELSIKDDGQGIRGVVAGNAGDNLEESRKPGAGGGNGLRNMRQRIEQLGGGFKLESEPGNGTKINILIPLK